MSHTSQIRNDFKKYVMTSTSLSLYQKYFMMSKIHNDVKKVSHGVKSLSWCQKVLNDVNKFVMALKMHQNIKKLFVTSKICCDVKNIRKICYNYYDVK